ncbi:unnamed protein product [Callosobruchus maculatus]|uniref:Uncharacterized protein n=1 Tax=Callosobruchus maculatus TaxID=64391 RepID=A0A653DJ72_CALMS|nr:unnamed protein product [Callosobruchus maculatus]
MKMSLPFNLFFALRISIFLSHVGSSIEYFFSVILRTLLMDAFTPISRSIVCLIITFNISLSSVSISTPVITKFFLILSFSNLSISASSTFILFVSLSFCVSEAFFTASISALSSIISSLFNIISAFISFTSFHMSFMSSLISVFIAKISDFSSPSMFRNISATESISDFLNVLFAAFVGVLIASLLLSKRFSSI